MNNEYVQLARAKTEADYNNARDEYRARGGTLFVKWSHAPDAETCGVRLAKRLQDATLSLVKGYVKAEFLHADDCADIIAALQLPLEVHYAEYTYVGSGGNCREDRRFNIEECWEKSEETEIRAAVVQALYTYCQYGGALSRWLGAKSTQKLFMRALYHIETNCRSHAYENVAGGCSEKVAKSVCAWVVQASRELWAENQVEIGNILLQRGRDEVARRQRIVDSRKKMAKVTPEAVKLGPWAAKIVKPLEPGLQTLVFIGNQEETLTVPEKRAVAWNCLKAALTTTDPQGWASLPEAGVNWTAHFRVLAGLTDEANHDIADPYADLTRLRYHLEAKNARGKHGVPQIRLRTEFNCKEFRKVRETYEMAKKLAKKRLKDGAKDGLQALQP